MVMIFIAYLTQAFEISHHRKIREFQTCAQAPASSAEPWACSSLKRAVCLIISRKRYWSV